MEWQEDKAFYAGVVVMILSHDFLSSDMLDHRRGKETTMRNQDTRLFAAVSLAGPLIDQNLTADDADSLLGMLLFTPRTLLRQLVKIQDWQNLTLLELIPEMIHREHQLFKTTALLERWRGRREKYHAERSSWLSAAVEQDWRLKPMSMSQGYLIQSTAALLVVEIPTGMNRGEASDWLETHMAHLTLTIDEEMKEIYGA